MVDKILAVVLLIVLSVNSNEFATEGMQSNIANTDYSIESTQNLLSQELPINEIQKSIDSKEQLVQEESQWLSFVEAERPQAVNSTIVIEEVVVEEEEVVVDEKQLQKDKVIIEYAKKYATFTQREQLVLGYLIPISFEYADKYKIRPSVLVAQAIGEGGWINWNSYYEMHELGKTKLEISTEGWASGFGQKSSSSENGYVTIFDNQMIDKYCENITGNLYVEAAKNIKNYDQYLNSLLAIYNPEHKVDYTKKIKLIIEIYDLEYLDELYEY